MATNGEVIILIEREIEGEIYQIVAFEYSLRGRNAAHEMAKAIVREYEEDSGMKAPPKEIVRGVMTYYYPGGCVVEIYDSVEVRES